MLKILIYLNLAIALIGTGVVFYSHNFIKPAPTDQIAEKVKLKEGLGQNTGLTPVPIKKFTVNLDSDVNRLRFLSLEMNVLPFYEDQKAIISKNEFMIKDVVIELATKLAPEEVETVTGKMLFESRIKKQVNAKLGQPVIKQIFFSGFVIQ